MPSAATRLVEQGRDLHARGHVSEAAICYEAALRADRGLAEAWHLLGVAAAQAGSFEHAVELISKALALRGGSAAFHRDRGLARLGLGEFRSAVEDFEATLRFDPVDGLTAYNLGFALQQLGDHDRAISAYEYTLDVRPDMEAAKRSLGSALLLVGRAGDALKLSEHLLVLKPLDARAWLDNSLAWSSLGDSLKAIESAGRACDLEPGHADAWAHLAGLYVVVNQPEHALQCCTTAGQLDPRLPAVLANRASALALKGLDKEALHDYDLALELDARIAEVHHGRGLVLQRLRRFTEAAASHFRASQLKPDYVDALLHTGVAYHQAGALQLARDAYESVLRMDANHTDAHYNLGLLHHEQERLSDAATCLEQAVALDPAHHPARWNLTLIRLAQGDFWSGWRDYSLRWNADGAQPPWLDLSRNRWQAGWPSGPVLAWSEQGLGDTILLTGFLGILAVRLPGIRAAVDPRLVGLLSRSYPGVQFLGKSAEPAGFLDDHHVPLGDVPSLLLDAGTDSCHANLGLSELPKPALVPDWSRVDAILHSELRTDVHIVGISWRSTHAITGSAKSLSLEMLEPLLRRDDLFFVNLQYGAVRDEIEAVEKRFGVRIHQLESIDLQNDLDGLAALICCCDTVVTCSNTTAHLAGALGRKTLLLAPHGRALHWYWRNRIEDTSAWYPSISIIDQSPPGSWEYSVAQLDWKLWR